jgi:phosphoserine phosphatase RsbU/P
MRKRYQEMWRRFGWIERIFLVMVLFYAALRVFAPASGDMQLIASLAIFVFGVLAAIRLSRALMRKAIWRLRNRLIAAYVFIAVVPISLVMGLAGYSGYMLIGQVAAYLVRTELASLQGRLVNEADMLAGYRRGGRGGPGGGMAAPGAGRGPGGSSGASAGKEGGAALSANASGGRKTAGPSGARGQVGRGQAGRSPFGFPGRFPGFGGPGADSALSDSDRLFNGVEYQARQFQLQPWNSEVEILVRGLTRPGGQRLSPEDRTPALDAQERARNEIRYPATSTLNSPSSEWGRSSGLILRRDGKRDRLYLWAHSVAMEGEAREATIVRPVTGELLANLVPKLGIVYVNQYVSPQADARVPEAVSTFDVNVSGWYNLEVSTWNSPADQVECQLVIDSRLSTVLGIIFAQKVGKGGTTDAMHDWFLAAFGLFLLAEMASLWAGVKISRTMTGAVHELYEGTQHVKEGDFKYRIPVKGDDQLADLSNSFNTMTENLGNLVVVAQEKERLQSELEIAREVQNQLFPRDVPSVKTLELKGMCKPARVVSGDYYDFLTLPGSEVAFAIGDVAGKGISAALLMASIQSAMRMQLNPNNGVTPHTYSAAHLVSRLNKQLYATTTAEKYATFYFALYDEAKRSLTYTNAGHLSPLLVRQGEITSLTPTGTVVGAFPFAKYEECTIELKSGDILLAYTDGSVEPENAYGEMYGENRLKELLLRYAYADSSEIIARAMEAVNVWTGSSELQDDMTMIVARQL